MSNSQSAPAIRLPRSSSEQDPGFEPVPGSNVAPLTLSTHNETENSAAQGRRALDPLVLDPLLTATEVAERLHVTKDWVWDHSSRKAPYLPVIRMGDGTLRYRASRIEAFIDERERLTLLRRKRG
jgi:predicted DNA-binding transcriptional regulator AlpA